jgi:hypothetical protein
MTFCSGSGDRILRELREHDGGHLLPPHLPRHQLPHRHQHVHRRHPRELQPGHRGCHGMLSIQAIQHTTGASIIYFFYTFLEFNGIQTENDSYWQINRFLIFAKFKCQNDRRGTFL